MNVKDQKDEMPKDRLVFRTLSTVDQTSGASMDEHDDEHERRRRCATHYDPMTGLPNLHSFRDRLSHAMQRAKRHNLTVAILILDIYKLKEVNIALGYGSGDQALIKVAARIKRCLRGCDSVSRSDGDEFSVILEDLVDEAGVQRVAEKVIGEFDNPMTLNGTECFISVSVGIALFPDHDVTVDGLIIRADIALARAKASGENVFRFYSSDMSQATANALTVKNELRYALARGELFLQYQPQVDLSNFSVVGVEALVRWKHPQLGLVMPAQFIPIAEETGLIISIGEWVLETACMQSVEWRKAGLPATKVAVNISVRQLRHPMWVDQVRAVIDRTGVEPSSVELEITEGILIENLQLSKEVIAELRRFGVRISIDDFGTGYSSLSYLSELPLDALKMDGSFVKQLENVHKRANSYSIASSIVHMAHAMGLTVIAEAVETETQLECLSEMKCDQIQGYIFSQPVDHQKIASLLGTTEFKEAQSVRMAASR